MSTVVARQGYEQRVRTARSEHRCYVCDGLIFAGERYLAYLATPHHDMNQTGRWLRAAFHRRCSESAPEWLRRDDDKLHDYAARLYSSVARSVVQAMSTEVSRARFVSVEPSLELVGEVFETEPEGTNRA